MNATGSDPNDVDDLEGCKSSDILSIGLKMTPKKNSCPPNICNGKLEKF